MRKQSRVLGFIYDKGIEGATYTEIVKFAYELSYGLHSYKNGSDECRGYWSGAFVGRRPSYPWGNKKGFKTFKYPGMITRNTDLHKGRYFLNEVGLARLKKLRQRKVVKPPYTYLIQ